LRRLLWKFAFIGNQNECTNTEYSGQTEPPNPVETEPPNPVETEPLNPAESEPLYFVI